MTKYFHDTSEPAVYELSGVFANEEFSSHKPPRFSGTRVSGQLKVTKPTRWKVGDRWTNSESSPRQNFYDRDREPQAKDYFIKVHCQLGGFTEIDQARYDALVAQFDAQANSNLPTEDDAQ